MAVTAPGGRPKGPFDPELVPRRGETIVIDQTTVTTVGEEYARLEPAAYRFAVAAENDCIYEISIIGAVVRNRLVPITWWAARELSGNGFRNLARMPTTPPPAPR